MKKSNLLNDINFNSFIILPLIVPFILLSAYNKKGGNKKMMHQTAVSPSMGMKGMNMKTDTFLKNMTTMADTVVVHLTLKNYAFVPDTLRIPAGQPVKIILNNTGSGVHEFMAGKGGVRSDGDGFNKGLFHQVKIHHNGGMVEGGMMEMTHQNMKGMNMKGMDMAGPFMIDVKPHHRASISFTLPKSKKGTWNMGCFVKFDDTAKSHYDVGMKGVFIVE